MGAPVGNQNARRSKLWRDAIVRALEKLSPEEGEKALDKIAMTLVMKAMEGEKDAYTEIGNRLDGKPATVVIGDEDEAPVRVEGRIKLVRPE